MKKTVLHKYDIEAGVLQGFRRETLKWMLLTPVMLLGLWVVIKLLHPICKELSPFFRVFFPALYIVPFSLVAIMCVSSFLRLLIDGHRIRKGRLCICTDTLVLKEHVEIIRRRHVLRNGIVQQYTLHFAHHGTYEIPHEADDELRNSWRGSENEYLHPWGNEGDRFYLVMVGRHIYRVYPTELFEIEE